MSEGDDDDLLRAVAKVQDRPPPKAERVVGTRIGRFDVIAEIGRGGMGIVYLAEDEKLRRKVALKVLRASYAADEERRRRFLREARAAAAVSHPNLVTVYDVGEHDGRAYIAMEYLRGRSLRELLGDRSLSIEEAIELARQILAGLLHAHTAGLLHRDLKPENVLVEKDGRVRLVDFGLAKLDGDDVAGESATTRDGLVMGTPGYMSPEQARGQSVDARSDIFSFGVMFHEMLTRQRPFGGPTRADVVSAILRDEPARADDVRPEIGKTLADVVVRCLAKAPADRWPSVPALIEALEDASATRAARASVPPAPAGSGDRPAVRRPRWPALAAIAGAAAIVIGIAIGQQAHRPAAETTAPGPDAASKGLAITDAPPPPSSSPEALAAYRQALQAFRDADWGIAEERLKEAIARDPELAAAHLRLAIIQTGVEAGASEMRATLSRAMAGRARLAPRDQGLLHAIEPLVVRDPAERDVATQRFKELLAERPEDAELWHLYGSFATMNSQAGVEAERKAVELDPQYADAWQILASQLARKGQVDEALSAIDRCIAISPLSADCRGERARISSLRGECAKMEEDLRRGLASNPRGATIWHDSRAAALLAIGRGDDTILEAYRQKWALMPEEKKKRVEPLDRALLAMARGRFAEADDLLGRGEKTIESDPDMQLHARYASARIAVAVETGRPKDAAKMAASFLAKRDVWFGTSRVMDLEIPMLRTMEHGGLATHADVVKRRDAWYADARKLDTGTPTIHFWTLAYGECIETPDEGIEAMAALPQAESVTGKDVGARAAVGHALLLAGQAKAAIPPLEASTRACNWLDWSITQTRALLYLGQAQEGMSNTKAACAAYQRIAQRWSGAEKSTTLDTARARMKALGCGGARPAGATATPGEDEDDEKP